LYDRRQGVVEGGGGCGRPEDVEDDPELTVEPLGAILFRRAFADVRKGYQQPFLISPAQEASPCLEGPVSSGDAAQS